LIIGVAGLVFYLTKSSDIKEIISDPVSVILGESDVPVVLEFGGEGMSAGYFQDAEQICVGADGNIYVAEYNGGKIQIFDPEGNYIDQMSFGKSDDIYLRSMTISRDGLQRCMCGMNC